MNAFTIFPGTKAYRQVRKLYLSAFPPEERRPFWHLWLLSRIRPAVTLHAYRENRDLLGFSLSVSSGKYLYICYLAVEDNHRSRGCGSRILRHLAENHPRQALLVEVEAPLKDAANYQQRLSRIAFYQRNGFFDVERSITSSVRGGGTVYAILSTDARFDSDAYWGIFPHLSFGLRAMFKKLLHRE